MNIEKLNKAVSGLRYYERVLADIDSIIESQDPVLALEKKRKLYKQYVTSYKKKYDDAVKLLK